MSYDGRPLMQGGGGGYGPVPSPGPYDNSGGYGGYPQQGGGYAQPPTVQGGYGQGGFGGPPQGGYGGPPQDSYNSGYSQPQTNYQIPQTNYQPSGGYPPQAGYPGQHDGGLDRKSIPAATTTSMSLVFFAAACCIMVGALVDVIALIFETELAKLPDTILMCYLFIFGAIMAVLDTPFFKQIVAMQHLKEYIGKYLNVLMRVTGKGLGFVFVGCILFTGIWNEEGPTPVRVLAVLLCLPPIFVGFAAIVVGVVKSMKLKKAQDKLKEMDADHALEQRLDQWAQTYRGQQCAFTPLEFNKLCEDTTSIKWEDADLKLIFDALVSNPKWRVNAAAAQGGNRQAPDAKIPKEDLLEWVRGALVWL